MREQQRKRGRMRGRFTEEDTDGGKEEQLTRALRPRERGVANITHLLSAPRLLAVFPTHLKVPLCPL